MKKMTNNGLLLCKIQADLFANYSSFTSCSSYVFIRRFMHSNLAKRFDDTTVLLDASNNETFVNELIEQYGKTTFGKSNQIDKEVMYWIGYVYRYWSYVYEVPSSTLFMHVQPKLLIDRYKLYHSMDVEYLIERISEEEKIMITPNKTISELLDEYIKNVSK